MWLSKKSIACAYGNKLEECDTLLFRMKHFWWLLTIAPICASQELVLRKLPAIGKSLAAPSPAVTDMCMVNPSQLDRCFHATVSQIEFTIAYRVKSRFAGPLATYIHTKDPKFRSPSGLAIGDSM